MDHKTRILKNTCDSFVISQRNQKKKALPEHETKEYYTNNYFLNPYKLMVKFMFM
jgi:hypothetical protein